jgi:hypothetical protein
MPCIDFTRVAEEYSVKVIEPGASLGATADKVPGVGDRVSVLG